MTETEEFIRDLTNRIANEHNVLAAQLAQHASVHPDAGGVGHRGEEGRWRELLVLSSLRGALGRIGLEPALSCSSGFLGAIDPEGDGLRTSQIDIFVHEEVANCDDAPQFLNPDGARFLMEVKTQFRGPADVAEAVGKLERNATYVQNCGGFAQLGDAEPWLRCGAAVVSVRGYQGKRVDMSGKSFRNLGRKLDGLPEGLVRLFSLGPELFMRRIPCGGRLVWEAYQFPEGVGEAFGYLVGNVVASSLPALAEGRNRAQFDRLFAQDPKAERSESSAKFVGGRWEPLRDDRA